MKQKRPFGDFVRRRRRECGKTQAQIAAEIGVKQCTVSSWETDRMPKPQNLHRLAAALDCDVAELIAVANSCPQCGERDPEALYHSEVWVTCETCGNNFHAPFPEF